jgi:hypothetical protein
MKRKESGKREGRDGKFLLSHLYKREMMPEKE